jgi:death on curing protein
LTRYLDLGDYLLIAEAVLGIPAERLARLDRIGLAESALHAPAAGSGGVDAYPEFATKAAVLCRHLVKNHPLPDGNKRAAFIALRVFAERNGYGWQRSPGDPDETDSVIRGVAADTVSETELAQWIRERLSPPA